MKTKKFAAALTALLWLLIASSAGADIFYAVSNYDNGSIGTIAKRGGAYTVDRDLVTNFGVDAWGFTFRDNNGAERAMIREYNYGPDDRVFLWDPSDWSKPKINKKGWASNIHAVATGSPNDRYLYLTTYESYSGSGTLQETGEVARVDMERGYVADKRYRYEPFNTAGHMSQPHGEAIHAEGGYVYVLFGISYNGFAEYDPSEIIEFNEDLSIRRRVKLLENPGNIAGKNPMRMACYDGRLYVACMGGFQGPDSWGDIWEVDRASMTARRVLDGRDIPHDLGGGRTAAVGMYGIQFASDGTAYILAGSYDADYVFRARLFVTTAAALSSGDPGTVRASYSGVPGYSWEILYDEDAETLWCMTGRNLEARKKDGGLIRTFYPSELGDNIYSFSPLRGDAVKTLAAHLPGLPGNVGTTAPAVQDKSDLGVFAALTGVAQGDFGVDGGGILIKKDVAYEKASALYGSGSFKDVKPLPAIRASLSPGEDTFALRYQLTGASLLAQNPSDVRVMKIRGSDAKAFTYASGGSADGTFRIVYGGGDHTGAIVSGNVYDLVLFIGNGGDFDLDPSPNGVADPPSVVGTKSVITGSDNNSGRGGGGESGGGCDAGFGWAWLFAAACLFVPRANRR
ncbi:MAG: hypothetical protein LBL51_02830 [Synergistaceae bacterium]|jgi:hypothetical protein|nr:hypothetical protein [Synergistaceae bacterium]